MTTGGVGGARGPLKQEPIKTESSLATRETAPKTMLEDIIIEAKKAGGEIKQGDFISNEYAAALGRFISSAAQKRITNEKMAQIKETLTTLLSQRTPEQIEHFEKVFHTGLSHYIWHGIQNVATASQVIDTTIAAAANMEAVTQVAENTEKALKVFDLEPKEDEVSKDAAEEAEHYLKDLASEHPPTVEKAKNAIQERKKFLTEAKQSKEFTTQVKQKPKDQRAAVAKFSRSPAGQAYLTSALRGNADDIRNALDQVIDAYKKGKDLLAAATSLMAKKVGEKLSKEDRKKFQDAWAQTAKDFEGKQNQAQFDDFLKRLTEHLIKLEILRAEQPNPKNQQAAFKSFEELDKDYSAQLKHFSFMDLKGI